MCKIAFYRDPDRKKKRLCVCLPYRSDSLNKLDACGLVSIFNLLLMLPDQVCTNTKREDIEIRCNYLRLRPYVKKNISSSFELMRVCSRRLTASWGTESFTCK